MASEYRGLLYAANADVEAIGALAVAGRVVVQLANPDFKFMSGEALTLEGGMGLRP
ncbi:hypothetical protein VJ918_09185 [Adlercreutzia sp. R21]|uniref:hypothetical protein n=1 Tax=Adlercreutzia wanghongyangiae TaxID=3111451 RepID=UPI002DB96A35|nr:hypothetical protein [Adlercreutzia sp. R21]MEC4184979.1 hypothetical protein [Adlercreutzia sp. R21]